MNKKILNIILLSTLIYIFTGCSAKEEEEYNKPAIIGTIK